MTDSLYSNSPRREGAWPKNFKHPLASYELPGEAQLREKCSSALERHITLTGKRNGNFKELDNTDETTEGGFRYSRSQKILFQQPNHRRQSAECTSWDEEKDAKSYIIDSGIKPTTIINDEETSAGGAYSLSYQEGSRKFCKRVDRIEERYPTKGENSGLVMKRLSSLEDLVWKLYEELDGKIQDIFEDHNNKFREQNDIIKNIFHGFGTELNGIREEVHANSEKIYSGYVCDTQSKDCQTQSSQIPSSQVTQKSDSFEQQHVETRSEKSFTSD